MADLDLKMTEGLLQSQAGQARAYEACDKAAEPWQYLIVEAPEAPDAWHSVAVALRGKKLFFEAEEVLSRAQERFPSAEKIAELRAWNCMHLSDWERAEQHWRNFRETFPLSTGGYVGLFYVLRRTTRFSEMDALLFEAVNRYPDLVDLALHYASVPTLRPDWPEAVERYRFVRTKFPRELRAVAPLISALENAGRGMEIEKVLWQACSQFPENFDLAKRLANVLIDKGAWIDLMRCWDNFLLRQPRNLDACFGMAKALKQAGYPFLHARHVKTALELFPDNEELAIQRAGILVQGRDWQSALPEIRYLAQTFPKSRQILSAYGHILLSSGDPASAYKVLLAALEQYPDDMGLQMSLARSASARAAWREAESLWSKLAEKYPNQQSVASELGKARYSLGLLDDDEGSGTAETLHGLDSSSAAATAGRQSDIELVTRFESLGEDCEFGLFQRKVGAEPISLLRFAGTAPHALVAALQCRLDGVGLPENMELVPRRNGDEYEYVARDKRFGMSMHTHINPATVEFEATYQMVLRKVKYLSQRLLEDLEDGEKIFVYKDRYGNMEKYLSSLRKVLSSYGRSKLFVVKIAEPGKPNGHIEIRDELVLVGYIDRHGHENDSWNIPDKSWLNLCRKASEHWPTVIN